MGSGVNVCNVTELCSYKWLNDKYSVMYSSPLKKPNNNMKKRPRIHTQGVYSSWFHGGTSLDVVRITRATDRAETDVTAG
jgi:hypothetical protein